MVEYKIKIHPQQRLTRIPKILAQTFGFVWSLRPDTRAAIVYPEGSDLRDVLVSVKIIMQGIRLDLDTQGQKDVPSSRSKHSEALRLEE